MSDKSELHHIVIVGGGAGGLELATKLGNKLGKKNKAEITLVDCVLTHLWKPLLHEVAAGSLNSHEDELSYMAQAHWHHFRFRLGRMDGLDRQKQQITLAPTLDDEGTEYIPRRTFHYDTLIIAVGSVTNDFGIPGVREHCMFLDTQEQANRFHKLFLKKCTIAHTQVEPLREGQLHIAIAGAGATGVELSAELYESTRQLVNFGLDGIDIDRDVRISIVEASDRILPALPERLSKQTAKLLDRLDIKQRTGQRVTEATAEGFHTESGEFIPAELKVWAAGIKAPDFLADLDGLETTNNNLLVVTQTLQTTNDENIFAFGDCAACPDNGGLVPPRAQAAHQQASMLYKSVIKRLKKKKLPTYKYTDYGSLINMSRHATVGNLMGNLGGKLNPNIMVEGVFARLVYMSLYKMHQYALHGFCRVVLTTIANMLTRRSRPRMKFH